MKQLFEERYEKVTVTEGLMTIIKKDKGFEICMRSYIEDSLKQYGKCV